jgi:TonB-linked SusC/RagA family outer membrane protein
LTVNASKLEQNGLNSYPSYTSGFSTPLDQIIRTSPANPIYAADGRFNYNNRFESGDLRKGDVTTNALSDLLNTTAQNISNSLIGNFNLRYAILPELIFKATAGTSITNATSNFFAPSYTSGGFSANGYASVGNRRTDIWQYEYTLNYTKQLNKDHYVDALAGYTTQTTNAESATASATNFANEQLLYHNLSSGATRQAPSSSGSEAILNSVIGRINYTFKGRYNLTGTFRADGSSRFAANNKWGYFPSIGLSWNVNEEAFLKDIRAISALKLRASFGTVGNQEIGNYQYEATYGTTSNYSFNQALVVGYVRSNLENPDLKWEQTAAYNVGFDLSVLKSRLNFVFDAYYKKTSDLLLSTPVEITTGFSSVLRNIGNISNKGLELEANASIIDKRKLKWSVSANIAKNINKVLSLTEGNIDSGTSNIQVGKPLGYFYTYLFDGVIQTGDDLKKIPVPTWKASNQPGDAKFKDINGDGVIDVDHDRVEVGSRYPDFIYGFSTSFRYKSFDLFASFQGNQGNYVNNSLRLALESPSTSYNSLATLVDRWTPTNPSNTVPRAVVVASPRSDSRYIEDASYLRLKNISLSYILPFKIERAQSTKIKVFASAQNLLTVTKYSGYDPEATGTYPNTKSFTFGIGISY